MQVNGLIIEELNENGKLKSFVLNKDYPLCPFIIDVFFGNMYPSFLDIPSISFQQT